jgi:hypothetical protein
MGKLHLDLFCQDKYLLNHVDLKIKLRRSRDAFALVADAANYKIKIKEMACPAVPECPCTTSRPSTEII